MSEEINSEGNVPTSFPKTIEDAMIVARHIGVPYLWVDRYCIDQKDHEEKHLMISNMDKIYAGAELTIVASSGSSPNYGLPGISEPRHPARRQILNPGVLDLFKSINFDVDIRGPWSQRAWTFQEMLLSRRRLVFTGSQMMFRCCCRTFLESLSLKLIESSPNADTNVSQASITSKLGCPLEVWRGRADDHHHVGDMQPTEIYGLIDVYSQKILSHFEDRLNAMEGIFSAFRDEVVGYSHHFWGIPILEVQPYWDRRPVDPTLSFCIGLQWLACSGMPSLETWPSWSWAARSHRVHYDHTPLASLHSGVSITIERLNGHIEDLVQFACGTRNYKDYHPWIDLTTWVGPYVDLDPRRGELYHKMHPPSNYIAMYIGTLLDTPEFYTFLVTKETDDGSFRRVGLARHEQGTWKPVKKPNFKGRFHSSGEIKAWDEKIRQEKLSVQHFFVGWDCRTVRLV